ncbi:unnamed protein product [Prorocentrum cordatum]|uniref:Uncharacterized protein n=1 Tax=Prorocentrum cordatum TaxID=2364126 RepID=A0ABN9RAQ4_9DINO|nr:unnamed protein product [Polarella glacialis]
MLKFMILFSCRGKWLPLASLMKVQPSIGTWVREYLPDRTSPVFERLLEIPPPPERHAEAAAAAAAAGPPALLPISRALREARKVTLPIGAPHGAPLRPALGAEGDLQRGAPKGPVTLAASMHAEIDRGGPARAGGEEAPHFGASPRYSVRRARPARPGLA